MPYQDILELTRHSEATGWDGIWFADHFMPNAENTEQPWPEAWITLAALGATVPRIKMGTLVAGNTYRHPAVLAKMAVTLDHITNGRIILGLGSGWQENEHTQYGIPFMTVGKRLDALEEACAVITSLFENPTTNFSGDHYQLTEAVLEPKPLQKRLPLLIGGGGEKRTLKITAQYADAWNVWGDPETLRRKNGIIDGYCTAIDRDPKSIHRTAVALLFLNEDAAANEKLRNASIAQPTIIGTVAEVKEIVAAYAAAGVDELIIPGFNLGSVDATKQVLDVFLGQVAGR
jgi:F420-dependent oxidoreductase-like protein